MKSFSLCHGQTIRLESGRGKGRREGEREKGEGRREWREMGDKWKKWDV